MDYNYVREVKSAQLMQRVKAFQGMEIARKEKRE